MIFPLMSMAPMGLLVGLVMVLSARGTAPSFADTLPEAPAAPPQVPSAKWPPEPARAGSAPSAIIVLAGLVVSSLVLFMAGVFGALAFAAKSELFANIVLPVAIGGYAVYVITAIALLAKSKRAANWVAWAPFILLIVIGPVGQVIAMLFR